MVSAQGGLGVWNLVPTPPWAGHVQLGAARCGACRERCFDVEGGAVARDREAELVAGPVLADDAGQLVSIFDAP